MIGVLLVTHGEIGTAMLSSANQILGGGAKQVATLSVWRQDDPDDLVLRAREPDLALKSACDVGELRRGARVQAEAIDDCGIHARHQGIDPSSYGRRLRRRRKPRASPPR